jgi:hypothetical protein
MMSKFEKSSDFEKCSNLENVHMQKVLEFKICENLKIV